MLSPLSSHLSLRTSTLDVSTSSNASDVSTFSNASDVSTSSNASDVSTSSNASDISTSSSISDVSTSSNASDISTSGVTITPSGNEAIMITPYGRAHPLRVLRRSILSTEAPEDIVRRAMKIYDFEKSYLQQPEEVIDEVEQMLGMKEIQWPSLNFRLGVIRDKLHVSLKAILRLHGYQTFAFCGQDKKARLQIAPPGEGKEPPPLPEWLQIPYIVPVKGYPSRLVFDTCANPTTRTGDALYDHMGKP